MARVLRGDRDYQVRATAEVRAAWESGERAVCLVAPTGSGKTHMGAMLVAAEPADKRVLWIAHRQELVSQAAEKLRGDGLADVEVISASHDRGQVGARIVVASIQTLLARDIFPEADLLVPDEAHHFMATDWGRLVRHYERARIVGLTATPERGDGRPLGDMFGSLVVAAQPNELIAAKHLVPCKVYAPDKHQGSAIAQSPVDMWRRFGGKARRTVIFASSRDEAKRFAGEIAALGGRVAYVDGTTPRAERAKSLASFEAGRIDTLVNVHVFTEGWDCPPADVCILARPCRTAGQYIQIVGRILRSSKGKRVARLVDLVGAVHKHGSPTKDREYTLDGKRAIVLRRVDDEEWAAEEERERKSREALPVTGDEVEEYISLDWDPGRKYAVDGIVDTLAGHARRTGVDYRVLCKRIKRQGMSPVEAVRTGYRTSRDAARARTKLHDLNGIVDTLSGHAKRAGISLGSIQFRVGMAGMSLADAVRMGRRTPAEAAMANARTYEVDGIVDTIDGHGRRVGVSGSVLRRRMERSGMSPEEAVHTGRRTALEAAIARRGVHEVDGIVDTVSGHARRVGVAMTVLTGRMKNQGMSLAEAARLGKRTHAEAARSSAKKYDVDGVFDTIPGHARRIGVGYYTLKHRIIDRGMSVAEAVQLGGDQRANAAVAKRKVISFGGRSMSMHEWASFHGISYHTMRARILRMPLAEALYHGVPQNRGRSAAE